MSKYFIDYPAGIQNPLDTYLKMNGYTRYRLAKSSDVSPGTLLHVSRRKVENMEGKYYIFVGNLIHKKPSVVFEEMLEVQAKIDTELDQ